MKVHIESVDIRTPIPTARVTLHDVSYVIPIASPRWWGARLGSTIDLKAFDANGSES